MNMDTQWWETERRIEIFGFCLPACYAGCHKLEGGFVKGKAEVAAVKDSKTYGFFD